MVEKLCLVERDNRMSQGRRETDSDHILKLSFLVMMVNPYLKNKADYCRMLELALVHDLVEARSGDYSLSAQIANPDLRIQKAKAELDAINYYKSVLPHPLNERIYDLFMEYEERTTLESKVVYILDKIEANLQANQYNDGDVRYWADCEGGDWYYHCAVTKKSMVQDLGEEILIDLENAVIEISKRNIEKCGIQNCN